MRLQNKVCIVTGAGSDGGIGEAIARRFVSEGANVFVCDIDAAKSEASSQALGPQAIPWVCDVTQSRSIDAMVTAVVERFGQLDVMVNNVGFTMPGFLGELSDEAWLNILSGNLSSTFYGIRAALKPMRRQKSGSIINIGSAAGSGGAPGLGAYGAAKAGVASLTQTAAIENFKAGVRVNCILPNAATKSLLSWFDMTDAGQRTRANIEAYSRCGSPDEIAAVAAFLASADSSYVNGVVLPVDGGLSARVGCIDAEII